MIRYLYLILEIQIQNEFNHIMYSNHIYIYFKVLDEYIFYLDTVLATFLRHYIIHTINR